ncbi:MULTISPECIES: glycerate kinase [Rhodococcus]|uniref:Glycerate kinase n=1 Tax=Rhodococcus opacus RKJ300 = JCM 13270 TaxID=1165867 RepID=I0WFM6_RHOOP|nr:MULTISPECIES: glycerate kinase [Rhodococcus]EID75192.1 glycerate kinase [Rhodococcus opacus RKJ300 = JCM 13270]QQZ14376.1 glycerate kinase [Rhodococcus sp. 21391]
MPRHVVVAPDKFKGSISAADAAAEISRGLQRRDPTIRTIECPIADGGEGTLAAALAAGFERIPVAAPGPTGERTLTAYARKGQLAVIEMADISGLHRLPAGVLRPMTASSRGLGTVLARALDDGCREIVLGIGGSACTDGGAGFLRALGAEVVNAHGSPIRDGGGALSQATMLDVSWLHPGLGDAKITLASDVDNPLYGPTGAAAVYGPQKGATPTQVAELDAALAHWADRVAAATGRDARDSPGAGAAGGVGFAALTVLQAEFRSGIDLILELVGIDQHLDGACAVITGEGSLDHQSLHGKAPIGVRLHATARDVPTYAIVGVSRLSPEEEAASQFAAIYSLQDREPDVARSMAGAADLIASAAEELAAEHLLAVDRT